MQTVHTEHGTASNAHKREKHAMGEEKKYAESVFTVSTRRIEIAS